MSQIERLYWIDNQIRSGHYPNAEAVCHQFGVSRRTAFADRDHSPSTWARPLTYDRRRGGWAYTDPTYLLPFLALTEREAATLRRSLLAAREYLAAPDAGPVSALAQRLQPFLPPLAETAAESMGGAIQSASGISASAALLDDCRRGIGERRRLRLLYYSAAPGRGQRARRAALSPAPLARRAVPDRLVRVAAGLSRLLPGPGARMGVAAGAGDAFTRDPAFDVEAYLQPRLRAAPWGGAGDGAGALLALPGPLDSGAALPPSQQTRGSADGGLEMTLSVAGTAEVKRWLLGYGAEVEVWSRSSLRSEMAAEAKKLREIYAAP